MVSSLRVARNRNQALGLTVLRVTLGVVFLAHGVQELMEWGWRGGAPFFADAGIPFAGIAAPLVTAVEIAGGSLLVLGLASRMAGAVLAVVMVVALLTVHWPHGFFLPNGYEFVLVLAAGNLTVLLSGPGSFSLDGQFARNRWVSALQVRFDRLRSPPDAGRAS